MRRERILVVEDENIVAMDIQHGLKHLGYDVPAIVSDGDNAIEKAREINPDLILMDIQIKGERDGIETAKEIWNTQRIPVIFLTAYADEKTLERAKGVEPFGYILKPFEETELHTAIEVALKKHRTVQKERADQEAALAASENRFQLMVESVKDYAIFMLDPNGNVATWNAGAERLSGYTTDEIIGKHFSLFYPEIVRRSGHPQHELEIARQQGRYEEEGLRVRKDGSQFWASIVITAVKDQTGNLVGFGKVARDLTAKKKAEERTKFLAEVSAVLSYSLDLEITLKEMASLIVPRIADWCVIDLLGDDGILRRMSIAHKNPEKRKFAEELQHRYPPDLQAPYGAGNVIRTKHPELAPEISENLIQAMADRRGEEFAQILRSLGLSSYMTVPLITRDRVLGAISFISEDQSRRYNQDDLEFAEELARRAAHAVENAGLYSDAQAAIRARDEFLSIASHELKTPLTALRLQAQITKRNLIKGDKSFFTDDRLHELADQLDKQVDRLSHLVEDMLDVSRIRIGKLTAHFEEINLTNLVRDVASRIAPQLNAAGCELTLDLDHNVVGFWDKYRLEQVVLNLLSNAAKYGAGKPIKITINSKDGRAVLKVKDQGIGIPKCDHERIFRRFERAISPNEVSGLGLGLYITREILEAHEGTIHVISEKGQGSEFIVELPLRPKKREQHKRALDYEF